MDILNRVVEKDVKNSGAASKLLKAKVIMNEEVLSEMSMSKALDEGTTAFCIGGLSRLNERVLEFVNSRPPPRVYVQKHILSVQGRSGGVPLAHPAEDLPRVIEIRVIEIPGY
jgi:hypothetical protein